MAPLKSSLGSDIFFPLKPLVDRKVCREGTLHFGSGLTAWWNSQKSISNHTGTTGKERCMFDSTEGGEKNTVTHEKIKALASIPDLTAGPNTSNWSLLRSLNSLLWFFFFYSNPRTGSHCTWSILAFPSFCILFLSEPYWVLWTSSRLRTCSCPNPTALSCCASATLRSEGLRLPGWQKILTKQVRRWNGIKFFFLWWKCLLLHFPAARHTH